MEGTICIWRPPPPERRLTDCLQLLLTFDAHENYVSGVAWDPCGRYLASQSHDGELKIWRTGDWTRETTVRISDSKGSMFFFFFREFVLLFFPNIITPPLLLSAHDLLCFIWVAGTSGARAVSSSFSRLRWTPDGQFVQCPRGPRQVECMRVFVFVHVDL